MDEQASFEARAVLAPRRARVARLALLVPAVALVAIAWAGLSGAHSDQTTAVVPDPTNVAAPSIMVEAPYPAQVVGLHVQRLDDVQPQGLGRDDVIAVAGWYVATATTDCPPLAALYQESTPPELGGYADEWAYCSRFGVLYASRPVLAQSLPTNAGLPSIAVALAVGIIVPPELEMIGTDARQVVVVGRFVESSDLCRVPGDCRRELVVDHVAWTPGV